MKYISRKFTKPTYPENIKYYYFYYRNKPNKILNFSLNILSNPEAFKSHDFAYLGNYYSILEKYFELSVLDKKNINWKIYSYINSHIKDYYICNRCDFLLGVSRGYADYLNLTDLSYNLNIRTHELYKMKCSDILIDSILA